MKSVAILLMAVSTRLSAQWLDYPDSRTPRTKDGKPNLSAPAPRVKGKPNLSGVWQAERTPLSEYIRTLGADPSNIQVDLGDITKYVGNIFWDVKPAEPAASRRGRGDRSFWRMPSLITRLLTETTCNAIT